MRKEVLREVKRPEDLPFALRWVEDMARNRMIPLA